MTGSERLVGRNILRGELLTQTHTLSKPDLGQVEVTEPEIKPLPSVRELFDEISVGRVRQLVGTPFMRSFGQLYGDVQVRMAELASTERDTDPARALYGNLLQLAQDAIYASFANSGHFAENEIHAAFAVTMGKARIPSFGSH